MKRTLVAAAVAALALAPISLAFAPMAAAEPPPCSPTDVQKNYYDQACQNCGRAAIQANDNAAYAACFAPASAPAQAPSNPGQCQQFNTPLSQNAYQACLNDERIAG